jgi:hypothetical protein
MPKINRPDFTVILKGDNLIEAVRTTSRLYEGSQRIISALYETAGLQTGPHRNVHGIDVVLQRAIRIRISDQSRAGTSIKLRNQ